jgi:hypothetical protein
MSEAYTSLGAVVFAALASFAAFWAAWETRKTAKATSNTAEGTALSDFLKEYSTPRMFKALRTLKDWKRKFREDSVEEFREEYKRKEKEALQLNEARRSVSHYFQRARTLYIKGYVSRRFYETVCELGGSEIMLEIVEPLEEVISKIDVGEFCDHAVFNDLRKMKESRMKSALGNTLSAS